VVQGCGGGAGGLTDAALTGEHGNAGHALLNNNRAGERKRP
jgi:hypothetical protein